MKNTSRTLKAVEEQTGEENRNHDKPHCLHCGSERISFRYGDYIMGHPINETRALVAAQTLLAEVLAARLNGADVDVATDLVSVSVFEISAMIAAREDDEKAASAAEPTRVEAH